MRTYILRVESPDEKGLVYRLTRVLFNHGLNMITNGEFVDRDRKRFYMRAEVEGECDVEKVADELRSDLPAEATIELGDARKKNTVVLATKESHCLGDLLIRHAADEFNANILAVISNRKVLGDLVERFDIPFHCISHRGLDREEHEAQVLDVIGTYEFDHLVLAKYMRILSSDFVRKFPGQMVNIHHSFLPAFIGANPYRQAFDRGVKIIGATAHLVTNDLDEGPIIAQNVIPVDHTHSAADMAQAGRDVEKAVLAKALKLVFEERVFISGNRTVIFD